MPPTRSSPVRWAAVVLLGVVLLQAAWVLVVPPFRGIDEFDHVYRAEGVVHGDWAPKTLAPHGRGQVVRVPADVVAAASAECASLPYTGSADCHPIPGSQRSDGTVEVTSSAGAYNPLYYALLGAVASPFHGDGVVYAMRVTCLVVSALVLLFALTCLRRARVGGWTVLGLVVALTPTFVYSTSVAAPNGLEMCTGLATWAALMAVLGGGLDEAEERRVFWGLAPAVLVLAFLRELGPLWIVLIVVCTGLWAGRERVVASLRRSRRSWIATAGGLVVGLVVAGVWHLVDRGVPTIPDSGDPTAGTGFVLRQTPVWIAQLVNAIPLRDEPGPIYVYPLVFLVIGVLTVVALRRGGRGERWSLGLALVAMVVFPLVLTFATKASVGVIWQGRYQFPFVVGLMPLAGAVLDRVGWLPREGRWLRLGGLVLVGASMLGSLLVIQSRSTTYAAGIGQSWSTPPAVVVVVLAVAAYGLFWWAMRVAGPAAVPTVEPVEPSESVDAE